MFTSFRVSKASRRIDFKVDCEGHPEPQPRFADALKIIRYCGVLKAEIATRLVKIMHICLCLASLSLLLPAQAQHYRMSEEIISDPTTGAALMGYDPVSYFLNQKARIGNGEITVNFAGKIWHFESAGNRAAFEANPEAYLPGFGGHDPISIVRGVAVHGNPMIHTIHEGRLYLFRRPENRDAFLQSETLVEDATRNWPEVKRNLVP